jgi:ubiquinone/menaquinone biosynthesis C-methylase UbiE
MIGDGHPLDAWHLVLRRAFGTDVLAQVGRPRSVLDIACGTGRWARDVARQLPEAQVVGFDLDARLIDAGAEGSAWSGEGRLPPNCRLSQGNALETFPFPDGAFDYAHLRLFSPFLQVGQVLPVLAEMRRVTHASGWIELVDAAEIASDNGAVNFLLDCLRHLYQYHGLALEPGRLLEDYLRQAGLGRARSRTVTILTDTSSSEGAQRLARDLVAGTVAASRSYVQLGITGPEQIEAAIGQARNPAHPYALRILMTGAWAAVP